ncbi:MAG: serine protease [Actinobacteria bacterium]|nr:serine protease [Actinomycetota bacterium]
MPADQRVPGYLGRVLDTDGAAVGTCFQVSPSVLITAWHVLNDLNAGGEGATVAVDALDGASGSATAEVLRIDPVHDLAVLRRTEPLSASVSGISATDVVELRTEVVVTGVSRVDDPEHEYRFLDAPGRWAGGTTRDDQVPLGRLSSTSVLRGMSGAPVRRGSDDIVVGVVSGRYNSADGWLRDSVWVARTEHLESLRLTG